MFSTYSSLELAYDRYPHAALNPGPREKTRPAARSAQVRRAERARAPRGGRPRPGRVGHPIGPRDDLDFTPTNRAFFSSFAHLACEDPDHNLAYTCFFKEKSHLGTVARDPPRAVG
jgi:hypothetical protein